jgi:hypothetical protein
MSCAGINTPSNGAAAVTAEGFGSCPVPFSGYDRVRRWAAPAW